MNTMFATPTHSIPTGFPTPWTSTPTNWFGAGAFNQPAFGYGYGPNGWWLGNQGGYPNAFTGTGFGNAWNGAHTPWNTTGWNTPGFWNHSTPWNSAPTPWNTAPFYNTFNAWNPAPSPFNQSWFGGSPTPGFFNHIPFGWNGHAHTGFPNTPVTFNPSFGATGFNPFAPTGFNQFAPTGFNQFAPTGFGPNPFTNSPHVHNGGFPYGTPWSTVNTWNTPTTGYTGPTTTPISGNNASFGYTGGYPTPFGNGVPAPAGCTGREAA